MDLSSDELFRLFDLHRQGFNCSQMLVMFGLEGQGRQNPDLVRCMTGLGGGLGFSGGTCGALTGGVCLLGLYAGRGAPQEKEHERFLLMVGELVAWFTKEIGGKHGGINCADIIGDEALAVRQPGPACANLVAGTWNRVREILAESGVDYATLKE